MFRVPQLSMICRFDNYYFLDHFVFNMDKALRLHALFSVFINQQDHQALIFMEN